MRAEELALAAKQRSEEQALEAKLRTEEMEVRKMELETFRKQPAQPGHSIFQVKPQVEFSNLWRCGP